MSYRQKCAGRRMRRRLREHLWFISHGWTFVAAYSFPMTHTFSGSSLTFTCDVGVGAHWSK
jgi:hypothetical protein